jgi:hypothetical protein
MKTAVFPSFRCFAAKLIGCPPFYTVLLAHVSTLKAEHKPVATSAAQHKSDFDLQPRPDKSFASYHDSPQHGDSVSLSGSCSDREGGDNPHYVASVASTTLRRVISSFRATVTGFGHSAGKSDLIGMERGVQLLALALIAICVVIVIVISSYVATLRAYGGLMDTHGGMMRAARMAIDAIRNCGAYNSGMVYVSVLSIVLRL